MNKIYLALGSNLGNRERNLLLAAELLESEGLFKISEVSFSNVYETKALTLEGPELENPDLEKKQPQSKYLNAALSFENNKITPEDLLNLIQKIERKVGRKREKENARYESRVLDIDIIFFKDKIIKQDSLIIPHPEISNRMFVLKPLLDLDAEFIHPRVRKSINRIYSECKDKLEVQYFCSWSELI